MNPRIEGLSVVLLGQFNPAIFHPSWLAANNLVREEEATEESVKLIHPELTQLDMDWLRILVERNRFQASTVQTAYYAPLRDLVLGTFSLLSHTPVTAMGINRDLHYGLDPERIDRIIGELVGQSRWASIIDSPTLSTLTMRSPRTTQYPGYVQVQVQPSHRLREMGTTGLYIQINSHYELGSRDDRLVSHERLRMILENLWDETLANSVTIASKLLGVSAS
jgi:hypothetical protein